MQSKIFDRELATEPSEELIGAARYNLLIGSVLFWGFAINCLIVQLVPVSAFERVPWLFLLAYFASCFFGTYLLNEPGLPWRSFIGYNFIVVPFGLVINLAVSRYAPSLVSNAMSTTALVTLMVMALSAVKPEFFEEIGGAITMALLAVIVAELISIFIFGAHNDIFDWAIALIFCGYIGYDWGHANQIPRTAGNAIGCAAALYMDIVNLFLRILRLFSDDKD